jgi:hypothetical protein
MFEWNLISFRLLKLFPLKSGEIRINRRRRNGHESTPNLLNNLARDKFDKKKIVILHFFMVWTITWFWDEIRHGKTKVSSTLRTRGKTNSNICCFVYFCHHLRSKALPSKSLTFSKRTMLNHPRSSRIRDFFAA